MEQAGSSVPCTKLLWLSPSSSLTWFLRCKGEVWFLWKWSLKTKSGAVNACCSYHLAGLLQKDLYDFLQMGFSKHFKLKSTTCWCPLWNLKFFLHYQAAQTSPQLHQISKTEVLEKLKSHQDYEAIWSVLCFPVQDFPTADRCIVNIISMYLCRPVFIPNHQSHCNCSFPIARALTAARTQLYHSLPVAFIIQTGHVKLWGISLCCSVAQEILAWICHITFWRTCI